MILCIHRNDVIPTQAQIEDKLVQLKTYLECELGPKISISIHSVFLNLPVILFIDQPAAVDSKRKDSFHFSSFRCFFRLCFSQI